jgi:CO dehydrogenase maturation factor
MKIAISGKGGVGKTTLSALLAYAFVQEGRHVTVIDADPTPNLTTALGIPPSLQNQIVPITEMADLIEERTGARPGSFGGFIRLNPEVSDIPERFGLVHRGIRLLELGRVRGGGTGCMCPENTLLKALVSHLLLSPDQVVILDMEAGAEHLGRGTAQAVNAFLIVTEPSQRSLVVAQTITRLARDIGLRRIFLVGNRVENEADREFIALHAPEGVPVLGYLPLDERVLHADRQGQAVFDAAPELAAQARDMVRMLAS